MKNIIKYIFEFSFIYLVIKEVKKAIMAIKQYLKARKERLAKEAELKERQAQLELDKMRHHPNVVNLNVIDLEELKHQI